MPVLALGAMRRQFCWCRGFVVGVARRQDALKEWQKPLGDRAGYVCHDLMQRDGMAEIAGKVTEISARLISLFMLPGWNTRRLLMK